jgi:hypothetical protein
LLNEFVWMTTLNATSASLKYKLEKSSKEISSILNRCSSW